MPSENQASIAEVPVFRVRALRPISLGKEGDRIMSKRSIPEIRAAEARQAEMVRELAAELRAQRPQRQQKQRGLLEFLHHLSPSQIAAEINGAERR